MWRTHREALVAGEGTTDIFIYPPFEFRAVGALLTNFHLPRSTLLMLVSAFAGRDLIRRAYAAAVRGAVPVFQLWRLHADCVSFLPMTTPLLEARSVSKRFQGVQALDR